MRVLPLKPKLKARYRRPYVRTVAPDGTPAGKLPQRLSTRVGYLSGYRDGAVQLVRKLQDSGVLPRW